MSDLTPIAPKLGKLIPRLASDQDGEVIATVMALRRTLASAGLDLHDLAAAIDRPPSVCRSVPPSRHEDFEPRSPADLADFIWNAEHGVELTSRESAFVHDLNMTPRYWRGDRLSLTEKQEAWLRAIYAKCRRAYDGGLQHDRRPRNCARARRGRCGAATGSLPGPRSFRARPLLVG